MVTDSRRRDECVRPVNGEPALRFISFTILFVGLISLPGSSLRADFITFSGTTNDLNYNFPARSTGFSRVNTDTRSVNLLLPKFDPTLGVLQNATISFTTKASGSVIGALRSPRSFPTGISANLQINSSLTPPGSGTSVISTIPFSDLNQSITVPTGLTNFGIDLRSAIRTSSNVAMPLSYLPSMTGTGTINTPFSMQFRQEIATSGGTIDYIFSSSVRHDFVLQYEFQAVPETSSVLLAALGIGLCLLRRKLFQNCFDMMLP